MPKNKTTGQKLADLMYGSPDKPAFGVYPMIAKRREDRQDREAAKNFPVDLGRGAFAGAAGLAGDIESLGRLPYVLYTGNESPTFAPTSEEILKRLPYGSDSPVGQFASGLGTLAGGSVPFNVIPKVIKAGAKGAMAAGRAGERMAEKYVPQIMERGGAGADILSGMAQGSRSNAIVYHGSPHKFDKFSSKKIGTGEGAQAYGHGLYFADSPEVAKTYQPRSPKFEQKLIDLYQKATSTSNYPMMEVLEDAMLHRTPNEIVEKFTNADDGYSGQHAKAAQDFVKWYSKNEPEVGGLYTVDLPDEKIARMLDYDKPLSSQHPDVQKALLEHPDVLDYMAKAEAQRTKLNEMSPMRLEKIPTASVPYDASRMAGQDVIPAIAQRSGVGGEQGAVEEQLRQLGIPGIRYLDEQSRGATGTGKWKIKLPEGEERIYNFKPDDHALELMNATAEPYGKSNYVVFPGEEDALSIVDRKAAGGTVHFSDNPDTMALELAGGGKVGLLTEAATKLAKALKPAKQAEAPMKASEALGRIEGRPLVITQADRTKVGGGYLGGPGFSGLQLTEPEYRAAEAAWGVKTPGVAKMILGGSKSAGKDPVYAAMLGTPTQHQSNQMVFDKLYGDFKKAAKKGDLDSDLRDRINMRLVNTVDKEGNNIFPPDVDILSKNFKDLANTFDRRAVTANLIGGMGVGGKKGQIIDYDKIIRDTTDPLLIDSPTGALGNRLFTLSGGVIDRPDLHPAFPTIMQGEDLGVSFSPVARDLIMKDFTEKTMREKGRAPGYMDYTRGYPPSQLITEDILTEMQKLGLKEGGAVTPPAAKIDGNDFVLAAKKYGLDDSMRTLNKIVSLVNQGATVDEAARIVSDATVRVSDNPDTMALELAGGGKVGAVTNLIKGFFSAVDKTAQNLKRPAGTGKEFMAEVKAAPGIKATELKGRKLAEIEAMPKMTKAEFIKELEARPPVKIEEKVLGQPSQKEIDELVDKLAYEKGLEEAREFSSYGDDIDAMAEENYRLSLKFDKDELQAKAREMLSEGEGGPFHGQYMIPGGENYREILLKMPQQLEKGFRTPNGAFFTEEDLADPIVRQTAEKVGLTPSTRKIGKEYSGVPAHFGGEPNILASIRVSDRMIPTYTPEQAESIGQRIAQGINVANPKNLASGAPEMAVNRGLITPLEAAQYSDYRGYKNNDLTGAREKVLHVEEIQSDWHQAGRKARTDEIDRLVKTGMSKQEAQAAVPEDYGYSTNMAARRKELGDRYKSGELSLDQYDYLDRELTSVPDAPFKKDWQELALRRVMQEAAEGGYDKVALTPGAEQASRYDLSQQIDAIEWNPEKGRLYAKQKNREDFEKMADDVTAENLADYIGKEAAEKLISQPFSGSYKQLGGVDLQVGGEGMKGFYDKMLPDYLNKLGKQYGVQVDEIGIPTPQNKIFTSGQEMADEMGLSWEDFSRNRAELEKEFWKMKQAKTTPVHGFEVTPQMREDINTKGQPLYSKIGIPGAEAAGATTIGSQIFDENNEQQVQNPIQFTDNPDAMRLELMQRN